jgi:hypothetical protein
MTPAARPSRIAGALAALGGAVAAFLVAAPYTVLDLPGFLNGFGKLMGSYTGGESPQAPWLTYAKHLRNAVQWPAMILILAGALLAIVRAVRGTGRVRWALAVTFPVLYFWFVSRQSLVYARYLMPLVPFVCLLAAAAVVSGVSLLRRFSIPRKLRTALIVALTVALLLPATAASISFNRRIAREGTLAQAYQWISANVPPDSMVVIESSALVLRYGPYRSRNVPQLRRAAYAHYVESGADYLVASSQCYGQYMTSPHLFPDEYAEYMRIFEQSETVATFTATADHPGPELRILKVRR